MEIVKIIKSGFFTLKAYLRNKKKDFTGAIKNSDKALNIYPKHHGAYWYKGTALYKLGKYNEALETYDKSLNLKPNSKYFLKKTGFQILSNIGTCYIKLNQIDKAIKFFNKAIEANPHDYKAYACKACAHSLQNEEKYALENLKKAIDIQPSYRKEAVNDSDFDNIKNMEEFQKITEG